MERPMTDDTKPYGRIDMDLMRPPQLFGCERLPFLILIGAVGFITVVIFGLDIFGLIGGVGLFVAGFIALRRAAAQDPLWFAVRWEAMKYPRHMPDVLPDPSLPRHLPFVGYNDPPARESVILAWAGVIGAMLVPAGLVWALFGLMAGAIAHAVLVALVCLRVFTMPKDPADDPWRQEGESRE